MHRWIVRVCSFTFAVVLVICSIQTTQGIQKLAPFGSTVTFNLNITKAVQTKDVLAQDLATIGEDLSTTIGKVSPNQENYRTERDVILFSGDLDSDSGPVVKGDKVFWLNQEISGHVIDYREVGGRTLNGTYFAVDTPGLRKSIQTWAEANSISVEWGDVSYLTSGQSITKSMVSSITGLLVLACFFLTLAAASVSLQKRWRQQKVELTEGKPYGKVRVESVRENLSPLIQGFIVGILVSLLYLLSLPEGTTQVKAVASVCAGPVLFFLLAVSLAVSLLSLFSVPPFEALGIRGNTSKTLKTFALILEFSGTTVVIIAIAAALSAINVQSQALGQVDTYNRIPNAARLSLLSVPVGEPEAEKDLFCDLVQQGENTNTLMLSLDVNQSTSLGDNDLGEFDHLLLVNRTYLDSMEVGVESTGPSGTLHEISPVEVPQFANVQTDILLAEDSKQAPSFYRYEGPGMICLGPSTGKGGESVVCKNPLVLIVDDLATEWSYEGFVLPLLSSGNIFFSDYQSAKELVDSSGASGLVASIDNMAELSLQAAQDISMRIQVLSFSAVVSFVIVIVLSFQAAASWCVASSRLIFAQRCLGRSLIDIATERMARRVAISAAASLVGFSVEFFVLKNSLPISLWVSLAVFILAVICQIAFRCHLASNEFHRMAIRR